MNGAERGFNPELRQDNFELNGVEKIYIDSFKLDEGDNTVNLEKFVNVKGYSKEEVLKDIQLVEQRKKSFEEKDTESQAEHAKLAHATERLIQDKIELSDWFGPDVLMVPSSEYDDFVNGFDAFVEFQDESRLGLALDFTFSSHAEKKIERIKREIISRKTPTAKYFDSENYIGPLQSVARLVLELDRDVIDELMRKENQIKYYKKLGDRDKVSQIRREIDMHPLQIDLLDQMLEQLRVFKSFALQHGSDNFFKLYEEIESNIQKIYSTKKKILANDLYLKQLREQPPHGLSRIIKLLSEE